MNLEYMNLAFKEAEQALELNEVPVGAVIVKNNKIIASAHNLKETDNCCTSHAEILAIQNASKILNNWRLDDCDIYVTLDPCPMCSSAIKQARIKNVFSALNNSDKSYEKIISEIFDVSDSTNSRVNFITNISSDYSKKLLSDFFKRQRNK